MYAVEDRGVSGGGEVRGAAGDRPDMGTFADFRLSFVESCGIAFAAAIIFGETIIMKNNIALGLALVLIVQGATAQFTGTLVYEIARPDTKLVMTYCQKGTAGFIAAYNVQLKGGVPDVSTMHAQDTILWDFANANETHLQYHTMRAFKQKYVAVMEAKMMEERMKGKGTLTVTSKGLETVNGYSCTHFVITTTSGMGASTRDVWVTKDLGPAATVWVMGSYLYFPPGYPHLDKLLAAGANGVVVKSVSSFGANHSLETTMNLVKVDKHAPGAALFQVPSRYNLVDETNMDPSMMPKKN
jgi:Domain of unknown function (DUF4412)